MGLHVAVAAIGGGKSGELLERLAPGARFALGIGPGEAPVERCAESLLVALGEVGEEGALGLFGRVLFVDRGGAADDECAGGDRRDGESGDHQRAHGAAPTGRRRRCAIMARACSPRAVGSRS
jgi:hypothetical protein